MGAVRAGRHGDPHRRRHGAGGAMKRSGVRRLLSLPLRRRDRWEREVEEEILTHLTIRAERLVALGMSPTEAKDEAIRRFGSLEEGRALMIEAASHREESMRRKEAFGELRQDVAFAFRTLSRNKGWAAVAIITLALGIGATTAVWSAASTVLRRPLPYPDAARVVMVNLMPSTGNATGVDVAIGAPNKLIHAWRTASRGFESLEPYAISTRPVVIGGQTVDLMSARVSATFAAFAGQRPVLGRNFTETEVRAFDRVAVISEALWQTRFGSDPTIIGRTITISRVPHRVIGVMPSELRAPRIGGGPTLIWLPVNLSVEADEQGYRVIGRLHAGVAHDVAARELDSISVRSGVYGKKALPFRAEITAPGRAVSFRDSLVMLAGAVVLVLLVSAANVAHLLLARSLTRQRELAIRTAVGAGQSRLLRQLMTETVILSAIGCAAGGALGFLGLRALVAFRPASLPELDLAHVDLFTLSIIITASLVCGITFGGIAALAHSRRQVGESLRAGAVSIFSRRGERLRSTLVISEMALTAVLLVGATLLVRSVIELQRSDLGFDSRNLHAFILDLPDNRYATPAAKRVGLEETVAALRGVTGIKSIAMSDALPGYRNFSIGQLEIEGQPVPSPRVTSFIDVGRVAPSYFAAIGAQLIEGRTIQDTTGASREVIVNEGFARKQWKGGDALGKRLRVSFTGGAGPWMTIVGVVKDVTSAGPTSDKSAPFLYTAIGNSFTPGLGLIFRADGNPATLALARSLARSRVGPAGVTEIDAGSVIDDALAAPRFIMALMIGFTGLSVILAAVGLYGMMAYSVAQRTREIGIRVALGASRQAIGRSIVGRGAFLGVIGAGVGLLLAIWGTRVIEGSLFGVTRLDVPSFLIGGVVLVAIAVLACVAPMRRAVAVDPMTAIRAD
jgi:putative ABC transport system permease protein